MIQSLQSLCSLGSLRDVPSLDLWLRYELSHTQIACVIRAVLAVCGVTVGAGSVGRLQGVCQGGGLSRSRNWRWQLQQNSWFIHVWFGFISSSIHQLLAAWSSTISTRTKEYMWKRWRQYQCRERRVWYFSWVAQPLKKALRSFETSGNTNPATQRYIPEDLGYLKTEVVKTSNAARDLLSVSVVIWTN
jgi:hypothetical protein